jgi:hypothetical protein
VSSLDYHVFAGIFGAPSADGFVLLAANFLEGAQTFDLKCRYLSCSKFVDACFTSI